MPRKFWTQLSEIAKQVWDKLSDHDKAIILGYSSTGKLQGQGPTGSSRSNYKANLHEISAFDFLQAHVHEFADRDNPHDEQEEFQDAVEVPGTDYGEDKDSLLINAATSNKSLHPGDITRVLSSTSK